MYFNLSDTRLPLQPGDVIEAATGGRIIVDQYIGSGGSSLMYLAHREGSGRYLALKELFPRQVENVLIRRQPEGSISLFDPISGTQEPADSPLWQELTRHFEREASLTRRAGIVYDPSGRETSQNHPDVLHVDGPFRDRRGNFYLAIDTYQGEPLRALIERGFVRDEAGHVISNQFLGEILDILSETAIRLSALHSLGLWHLDLSPDNIYIVPTAGQTRLVPYIIDYGSAYDRQDPEELRAHRYTCNPFSAPEVLALAQLQDPDCGYRADASSDTYALASILFYALTGDVFSSEHRMGRRDWEDRLRREFSAELTAWQGADSFAGSLAAFLEQGLSAAQRSRFPTATAIHSALTQLSARYRAYGNLLPLVEADELMSYMVLEKYPLYRYKGSDGNIHVLCLGSGVFVRRMILTLVSCGQMTGSRLYIHVVSNEPEDLLKKYLLTKAPMLREHSNLEGQVPDQYVTFSHEQVADVLEPETCRHILRSYAHAHYFVISLGSNSANIRAVRLYAQTLAADPAASQRPTILNYYCSEEAANTISESAQQQALPHWLRADAFGSVLSSYSKTIRTLGLRTLKLAHMYNKLQNPNISLSDSARSLASRAYDQRSSCAAALHLSYKLASIGIDPGLSGTDTIIAEYLKFLRSDRVGTLMELEHRRWMMYMIADGYRLPTDPELELYGFETVEGDFNGTWKCTKKKLHRCLVPCGTAGAILKPRDFETYNTPAAIAAAPFDALDRASLTLHMMAEEKCRSILDSRIIEQTFSEIALRLDRARSRRADAAPDALQALFEKVRQTVCTAARTLQYRREGSLLSELEIAARQQGINISGQITALEQLLSVFAECAARKDYKTPDGAIIRNLLWILLADHDLTLIKLPGKTISDNITGPLILDPGRLIFFGREPRPEWDHFLGDHGIRGQITYTPPCVHTVSAIHSALTALLAEQHGACVIDITGAGEQMAIAAQRAADGNPRVSLVRSAPEGTLENIHNFVTAPAYTLHTAISADEIFALYGSREDPSQNGGWEQLADTVTRLWDFYREFRDDWAAVTGFFADHGTGSPELHLHLPHPEQEGPWRPYTRRIHRSRWNALALKAVFDALGEKGIIREFSAAADAYDALTLSFLCPGDDLRAGLDAFFRERLPNIFVPLGCRICDDGENGYTVDIRSGCWVALRDPHLPAQILPALERLESLGLITAQSLCPSFVSFFYNDPAVRECLSKADSILELHIWKEARQTHYFDHARANFSFTWREGIRNELDVVLTRGLAALIISAKTMPLHREHLYEIKYLTEHFSLNSKPVIVCSAGASAQTLDPLKRRARAMGIWLIDLDELQSQGICLGDRLVEIAGSPAAD